MGCGSFFPLKRQQMEDMGGWMCVQEREPALYVACFEKGFPLKKVNPEILVTVRLKVFNEIHRQKESKRILL